MGSDEDEKAKNERLLQKLREYGTKHPMQRPADPLPYFSEKLYIEYIVPKLKQWFTVYTQVNAFHYSGRSLRYDLLVIPTDEAVGRVCQFPWFVIETKLDIYNNKYKEISEAYMQAYEYRNTVVNDTRFVGTPLHGVRPPAVMLCSDITGRLFKDEGRREWDWISRTFGRRGVYSFYVDDATAMAFTHHGHVFNYMGQRLCNMKNHSALRFSGGIADWSSFKLLLTSDGEYREMTEELMTIARETQKPPETPDACLGS